jgi:hypothetical protein
MAIKSSLTNLSAENPIYLQWMHYSIMVRRPPQPVMLDMIMIKSY